MKRTGIMKGQPRLEHLERNALQDGLGLGSLSVALVAEGSIRARLSGEPATHLECGALLVVRGPEPVVVEPRGERAAEILRLSMPADSLEAAFELAGKSPVSGFVERPVILDASAPAAKKLALLLRRAWMRSATESSEGHPLEWLSCALDIAGQALDTSGRSLSTDTEIRPERGGAHALLPMLAELVSRTGTPPTLATLAKNLGLSQRQTSRLFRAQMGESFRHYSAALRVDRAMKLLVSTDLPVTEIALASGWNSLSQFNAAFRKRTGATPGTYRRSYRGR